MVRASAVGDPRRSGDRGLSRRRLVRRALLVPAFVFVLAGPGPAHAVSESEAWLSARQAWIARSAAIGDAARDLAEHGTEDDVRDLRRAVAVAIHEFDDLEVHDCFRVWWSYVRTSFLLFDQALVGMQAGDLGRVQMAVMSSRYLAAQARATVVDCPARSLQPAGLGDALPGDGSRGLVGPPGVRPG
jgi:hypothetical protein